ncbi:MAG: 3-deoxy-manno-octulosonate cytidylyltransferase [Gammaproteobacteria bacterium]|nr:3-deoxy-manno-octulosonate cytidylyltransferase [Gammaproteobacteria bacterium]
MSAFSVVVPARYASTRLPGKPLAQIAGRPMIAHVAQRAGESGAAEVIVATDDERVLRAAASVGARAVMTRADHASGSDRVMEVAESCGWPDDHIVVNVQGDEPLIPPAVVDQVAGLLDRSLGVGAATLSEPLREAVDIGNGNIVKVVAARSGRALYFSRAPVPYARGGIPSSVTGPDTQWHRHIGIYAYRVAALRRFVALPVGRLEATESLEQLRFLENDIDIVVEEASAPVPGGVDTPADLERVRRAFDKGVAG